MAITSGDRLIDRGHYDITPEQEREKEDRKTADASEITAAEIRGLEMAGEVAHAIGMAYAAQKLNANVSQLFAGRAHMASRCAAQIADAITARIAELKAKTEP